MAVFTPLSSTALQHIKEGFGLSDVMSLIGIVEGDNESTFILMTSEKDWLVTVFESPVDPVDLERAYERMELLRRYCVPCPSTLRTKGGQAGLLVEEKLVALVGTVPGTQRGTIDARQAHNVGATIAKIHQVLLDHVPVRWPRRAGLVRGWLHGAITADNVFFQEASVSGIINFRLQHEGFLIEDLAQAMTIWDASEDTSNDELMESLITGYNEVRELDSDELDSLPMFVSSALLLRAVTITKRSQFDIGFVTTTFNRVARLCTAFAEKSGASAKIE